MGQKLGTKGSLTWLSLEVRAIRNVDNRVMQLSSLSSMVEGDAMVMYKAQYLRRLQRHIYGKAHQQKGMDKGEWNGALAESRAVAGG